MSDKPSFNTKSNIGLWPLAFRPKSALGFITEAFRIYRAHFRKLTAITAIVQVPVIVTTAIVNLIGGRYAIYAYLIAPLLQILIFSALIVAVSRIYLCQAASVIEAYKSAARPSLSLVRSVFLILVILALLSKIINSAWFSTWCQIS